MRSRACGRPDATSRLLRRAVLGGQRKVRGVGARDARVGDEAHSRPPGRVDDVGVLGDPLADLAARDEQEPVDTDERRVEGGGVGVVGAAHHDTTVGQVGDGLGVAGDGDDVGCGRGALEESLDDEAAEVTAGTGDEKGHDVPFGWG